MLNKVPYNLAYSRDRFLHLYFSPLNEGTDSLNLYLIAIQILILSLGREGVSPPEEKYESSRPNLGTEQMISR